MLVNDKTTFFVDALCFIGHWDWNTKYQTQNLQNYTKQVDLLQNEIIGVIHTLIWSDSVK